MFKVPEHYRLKVHPKDHRYNSDESCGNNGCFRFKFNNMIFFVIASDGGGWEHVSVSLPGRKRCPTWEEMCKVKNMFWGKGDIVIQIHPAKSCYVNDHAFCLHLWSKAGWDMEFPPLSMV